MSRPLNIVAPTDTNCSICEKVIPKNTDHWLVGSKRVCVKCQQEREDNALDALIVQAMRKGAAPDTKGERSGQA